MELTNRTLVSAGLDVLGNLLRWDFEHYQKFFRNVAGLDSFVLEVVRRHLKSREFKVFSKATWVLYLYSHDCYEMGLALDLENVVEELMNSFMFQFPSKVKF